MPIAFVQVGAHWINLDLVTSIELIEDQHQPGKVVAARVHYSTGKQQDFKVSVELQELEVFLRNHKAQ